MKNSDKATVFRELAKLLKADFHLDRSIDLLLNQKPKPAIASWLHHVKSHLSHGIGIAAAIRQTSTHHSTPNTLDIAMISAGEHSGQLAQSFSLLAHYYATLTHSVKQARSALLYPLLLVHLAVILPELPDAIASGDLAAAPLRILIRLSIFWIILALLAWTWRRLTTSAATSPTADRFLTSLPLIGSMRAHWALARFSQVAHSSMLAAIPPQNWLPLAGAASGSGQFLHGSTSAATTVSSGQPIAISLRHAGGFPKHFIDALDTAEESGTLDHELARWTDLETDSAQTAMAQVAAWLPKILYALIVLYVAFRIITMVTGIYAPLLREAGAF